MQIGMVGLGRMGADMVRRLSAGGHECIAHDVDARAVDRLAGSGIFVTTDRAEFLERLATPRVLWLMVPAAAVDRILDGFLPSLAPGDVVIDGGNSWYGDARGRAERLAAAKVHFIDCGTSGGVHGRERGYCLMLGGEPEVIGRLDPQIGRAHV